MEGKVRVLNAELSKLETAAKLLDVDVIEKIAFGAQTIVQLKFKQPNQLFELGECYKSVTPQPAKVEAVKEDSKQTTKK